MRRALAALALLLVSTSLFAAEGLRIVSAGPVGETATLAEANEIRVVFSEPMVVLGRIPQPVTAPFLKIEPAVKGTFRWSGTTTLIFTPSEPLPYATEFKVTVEKSAKSVAGNTLDQPYRWSFTTPTIRLLRADWYRKSNGSVVIALRFNQAVDAQTLVPHLKLQTQAHAIELPPIPASGEAKRQKALAAAASDGQPILSFLATDWNKERFVPGKDLVVLETKPGVPPDTFIQILIDDKLAQSPRHVRGREQAITIELEQTLFVKAMDCVAECDPEQRNAINFRSGAGLMFAEVQKAVSVSDVTDPAKPVALKPKKVENEYDYPSWGYGLDELGYSIQPGRKYSVRVDGSLKNTDGQPQQLGYDWTATVEYWHRSAFVSFGSGHGVWEATGGPVLPFHARNFRSVKQWLAPLALDDLMPTMLRLRESGFNVTPEGKGETRKLTTPRDKIASLGLNLKPAIGEDNLGLAWVAVEPGEAVSKSRVYDPSPVSTLVQSTNLGISVKDSPRNTIILVTRLEDAKPVEGAAVSIRDKANKIFWSGTTDANGIAVAPNTDLRRNKEKEEGESDWEDDWTHLSELHFVVVAQKDGDLAYVGSDWNEGVMPWDFGVRYDLSEAEPQLRGKVFADRGVYKLGEEVHFKLIARADTPDGMQLLAPGTKVQVTLRDSHSNEIDDRTLEVNAWSSLEWTFRIPAEAPLGEYNVIASTKEHDGAISGGILVAAYRRPDFRTDVTLTSNSSLAGTDLKGVVNGRYLFGAPMSGRTVNWTYSKIELLDPPQKITERWPEDRYVFLGRGWDEGMPTTQIISQNEATLDAKGLLPLTLETDQAAGVPYDYRLEGVVTDVTRQQIAGRASLSIDPAPWYIGLRRPPFFAEAGKSIDTEVVAAGLDGLAVAGVEVTVSLKRIQWTSVRQGEGGGFYGWESERKEIEAGEWTVTTKAQPVPLSIPIAEGGEYLLTATAEDADGRSTTTRDWFYAVGEGYTAWAREDHNRIELVPEKKTYKPGETARIMIKSPWETATALLTTEREGVRTWKQFQLTSTQQTITVPITDKEIPNVYVSVLLVKGRTKKDPEKDGSDPGKPAFRLGYVELKVEDASKRLNVDVKADRDEFRPAAKAKIEVNVVDVNGKPSQSEVTLWAVDYGVLSLTGYQTPDVLNSIYLDKALQVSNEDSRQRIISRRVLTPKGAADGGGGGQDAGPGTLRKDFRVLAFWLGSLVTDAKGRAKTEVTLPESLTTYRVMAVAGDKQSRFGWDSAEIRINKPLMLTPSWPRFLAVGDKAYFGGVVHNQLKKGGKATVTIESLDPSVLAVNGKTTIEVKPGSANEVRFDAVAYAIGDARIRMRVQMGRETDAFEDIIPVRVLVSPETVAAYGEAKPRAQETIEIPAQVVPGFGGLRVELASTAMVGLAEGARYLVEYPYGCAEQRSSRALALMLAADLGEAFQLPGIDPAQAKPTVQRNLVELANFQCGDGGFSFWPGDCHATSPYLTSYVVHVLQRGKGLGYKVDEGILTRAYTYLEGRLSEAPPTNEGWRPAYNAWQAFVVKVLTEGGRNADSHFNRIYEYRERMPVFALSFLVDALQARKETTGARITDLRRRITNSILPEGGTANVNELSDPYLMWFWSSNVRSTAIVLGTMVRGGQDEELVKRMVRWLMQVRKNGRWNDTQENAWAMAALVDFYQKYESEIPDFIASVGLGSETIARETFKGRSTEAKTQQFSMQQVLAKGKAGQQLPIVFTRDGEGTLYYMLRLRYAADVTHHQALDNGFHIERTYAVADAPASTTFKAGDLINVTLRIRNTKERRYVAVTDPIPAGTEPVEAWFATTATALAEAQQNNETASSWAWWLRGGFDYVERHDDRVNVFATRLNEGEHVFTYLVRATTAGTFIAAPTHAEEMYEPEVFGRTATTVVEVKK